VSALELLDESELELLDESELELLELIELELESDELDELLSELELELELLGAAAPHVVCVRTPLLLQPLSGGVDESLKMYALGAP
jgi:hypothetical protein